MLDELLQEYKNKMIKAYDFVLNDLSSVVAGRANLSILDSIRVKYYEEMTPLNQLANLSLADNITMVIEPWDKSLIKEIEKAIDQSQLKITPQNDGNIIRLKVPALTEERRKEIMKLVKKKVEDGKVAIRNVRREANDKLKKAEKNSEITEDDNKKTSAVIQKYTDEFIKKIDDAYQNKEKDILEI